LFKKNGFFSKSNPGYRPLKFEFKAPPSRPRGPLEALLTPEPNVQQISPAAAADKDQNRFREPLKPPPKIKGTVAKLSLFLYHSV
jgi:hypothetical protein